MAAKAATPTGMHTSPPSAKEKEIAQLREEKGLPFKEIGTRLGISAANAAKGYATYREKLKDARLLEQMRFRR